MKRSIKRYTDEQKTTLLDGFRKAKHKAKYCAENKISYQTVKNWDSKYNSPKKDNTKKVVGKIEKPTVDYKKLLNEQEKEIEVLKAKCDFLQCSLGIVTAQMKLRYFGYEFNLDKFLE